MSMVAKSMGSNPEGRQTISFRPETYDRSPFTGVCHNLLGSVTPEIKDQQHG